LRWWWREEGSDKRGRTRRIWDEGRKYTERVFHCVIRTVSTTRKIKYDVIPKNLLSA
jgi:hypothetical protein